MAWSYGPESLGGISSFVSAIIAVITLLTVYLAALQILTLNLQYRLGTSTSSLGPWKGTVVSPSLLKMRTYIATPKLLGLSELVRHGWDPDLIFPSGFVDEPKPSLWTRLRSVISLRRKTCVERLDTEECRVLAETTWVNFLESLGVNPDSKSCYDLQSESDLINGIVPMRWKGPDLVAICAMLGFQSSKNEPSFREPMPLPTQWSGPLGWMQFRAGQDGCIVEFRRRRHTRNQLSEEMHAFYGPLRIEGRRRCLKARLWQSINGFHLSTGQTLYLGGEDSDSKRSRKKRTMQEVCEQVMTQDAEKEEIRTMLWGEGAKQPHVARSTGAAAPVAKKEVSRSDLESLPEFLRCFADRDDSALEGKTKVQVLSQCPGLLSVIVEGEWTTSRGLDLNTVLEYDCQYMELAQVDKKTHPYNLGKLFVDFGLLEHLKDGILSIKPDGYYFTPTKSLGSDIGQIYSHVFDQSNDFESVIPPDMISGWRRTLINNDLLHAMKLCNEFQTIKLKSRATFTIGDMKIVSKASESLRRLVTSGNDRGEDLVWAITYSPRLLVDLVKLVKKVPIQDILNTTVHSDGGILDCSNFANLVGEDDKLDFDGEYKIPLMNEEKRQEFSGTQILAAYLDVFLTYFWIEKSWITDVAMYDVTVPQTLSMC